MSVYTAVSRPQLEAFLAPFELGGVEEFRGIEAGIENSNWFLTTARGAFVLTVFEHAGADELRWDLDLMAHLADHGIACARPQPIPGGGYLAQLAGKPAAVVERLEGVHVEAPQAWHCRELGRELARIHAAAAGFQPPRASARGRDWRTTVASALMAHVTGDEQRLLSAAQRVSGDDDSLPGGVIHADLFRDNALFDHRRLSGVLDFYYAHNGPFVYDLAVAVIDWCVIPAGDLDLRNARALADGYRDIRVLTAAEVSSWSGMMQAAASRFWLSRLYDKIFPRDGELTHIKDPAPFREVFAEALTRPRALDAVLA